MDTLSRRWIALSLLSVLGGCSEPEPVELMETLADSVRVVSGAPGVIVTVRTSSGVVLSAASGQSDLATERPMQLSDAYRLGSVSKIYTAALVLRLVEQGLLALDDPVGEYVASVPRSEAVTVRQLLEHTSGLRDFYLYLYLRPDRDEMIELVTRSWTEEELLGLVSRFGYSFDPGAEWPTATRTTTCWASS